MALDNPIDAYLRAAQAKNQNRRQAMQDAMGIWQNIGEGFNTIAAQLQERKKKEQWQKTINELMANPNTSPQMKSLLPIVAQNPGAWELLSGASKPQQTPVNLNFGPQGASVGGPTPPTGGQPSQSLPVKPDTAANILARQFAAKNKPPAGSQMTPMANVRQRQNVFSDLPSVKAGNASAAAMVQMSARQGKALVATPGAAQKIALGQIDLARTVQRSAPQLDAIRGAGFSDNIVTQLSSLQQKYTANPNGPDAPKIRKAMYDIFDDLDKTSSVYIKQGLDTLQSIQGSLPPNVIQNELGSKLPDIPFQEGLGGQGQSSQGGWGIQKVQ